jgi:very-long-chain enoyl-CoA reductase
VVITPGAQLSSFGLKDNDTIIFKDLGPQIAWKTVFHVEYAGPILIHALFYFCSNLCYGESVKHSYTQT